MRCRPLPEDPARAEQFGAKFPRKFKAANADSYSAAEQKAVRDQHHRLSIAWVVEAREGLGTLFDGAAASIPQEFVDDLLDVCVHHTKLNIEACPAKCKGDPTARKAYIAALLRFADELDIASTRVTLETVKTFTIDAANSLYWWLHNQTYVHFENTHIVTIAIHLHPSDLAHGPVLNEAFITRFKSKNEGVLEVLAGHQTPLVIGKKSGIVENPHTKPLPADIVAEIQKFTTPHKLAPAGPVAPADPTLEQVIQTVFKIDPLLLGILASGNRERPVYKLVRGDVAPTPKDETASPNVDPAFEYVTASKGETLALSPPPKQLKAGTRTTNLTPSRYPLYCGQAIENTDLKRRIGPERIGPGTLGCFVRTKTGEIGLLSDSYTLAGAAEGALGTDGIYLSQSSPGPRNRPIGKLANFTVLHPKKGKPVRALADVGLAVLEPWVEPIAGFEQRLGLPQLVGTARPRLGERMFKFGISSGLTFGVVTAIELKGVDINYPEGKVTFDNLFEIRGENGQPFGRPGDAGAAVVNGEGQVLGLFFAGFGGNGNPVGLAYTIQAAFELLECTLMAASPARD